MPVAHSQSDQKHRGSERLKILFIEDDPDDVYLVTKMLEDDILQDYSIYAVSSVSDSLVTLRQHKVDLILLDLGLSDTHGTDTIKALSQIPEIPPFVVLTGVNNEALGHHAITLGAEDYIPKAEANSAMLSRSIRYAIERHKLLEKIRLQAVTDALTGLPNRKAIFERLDVLIANAERNPSPLALAMIDLDNFKQVNDQLGHHAGDDLLQEISNRLKQSLRKADMCGRLGGDEFVLIYNHYTTTEELQNALNSKIEKLRVPVTLPDSSLPTLDITLSIGVAEWEPGLTPHLLLQRADKAMYHSKHHGKDGLTFFSELKEPE